MTTPPDGGSAEAPEKFDVIVIGSGPAGHQGALSAARFGDRVLIVEKDRGVGGACVQRGTIPSKTLRETAAYFLGLRERAGGAFEVDLPPHLQLASLMGRMENVIEGHTKMMADQLDEHGVVQWHGRARFATPHEIEVQGIHGQSRHAVADVILIATGSRPRTPPDVPVDHEHILDSDSILSSMYVPKSLAVLGAGVIASEYASIFAALGVEVTMIDRHALPVGFLDIELSQSFARHFESQPGCRFLGGHKVESVEWDGVDSVVTTLEGGEVIRTEKMLCALGRLANLEELQLDRAGIEPTERGLLRVDEHGRTSTPHIYAAGDVIGPPSLASASREQGRRAMYHALDLPLPHAPETIPAGIYTIPEMSCVGLTEEQAREQHGEILVGHAYFGEVARGRIAGDTSGFLKLVADEEGRLLGAHVFGESATELVHLAQMAMMADSDIEVFKESIFNFPTLAEVYQLAAKEIARHRRAALARSAELQT